MTEGNAQLTEGNAQLTKGNVSSALPLVAAGNATPQLSSALPLVGCALPLVAAGNAQPGGENGSKRHLLVDARGAPFCPSSSPQPTGMMYRSWKRCS
jgi:hypothetical protein